MAWADRYGELYHLYWHPSANRDITTGVRSVDNPVKEVRLWMRNASIQSYLLEPPVFHP